MDNLPLAQKKTAKTIGFFGIFVSLLAIFLLAPLFANSYHSYIGLQVFLVLLLMSINYSISSKKQALVTGGWIVFLFITLDSISLYTDSIGFMVAAYLLFIGYLFVACISLLKGIAVAPIIDNNLIFGALAAYLLIGTLWGKLYFLNLMLFPGSFHGLDDTIHEASNLAANFVLQFDLIYYSFTTLATLGMGDISPTHHLSKTLTVLEAMFGQLFVGIFIAKLVSVWRRPQ